MNTEVKAQWLADLRSGDYHQTQSYLHTTDGFCCWGVLADQGVRKGILECRPAPDDGTTFEYRRKDVGYTQPDASWESEYPQRSLFDGWTDISWDPTFILHTVNMNDGWDDPDRPSQPFTDIADFIQQSDV
jgi:hypothetical protein